MLLTQVGKDHMDRLNDFRELMERILTYPLMHFGSVEVTLSLLIYIFVFFFLLVYVTGRIKKYLINRMFARRGMEIGVRAAIASIVRYVIVVLGSFVILQTAGIDLSALLVVAGGLGIGLGFGLQNVISNFTSGLIILFERPIKVGDRIDVGGITGDVTNISLRATTVRTNENIQILVPNSAFTDSKVTNWTYSDRNIRIDVPVGVAYASDAEKVREVLLGVAAENPGVLRDPGPDVIFGEYGESSLNFILRVWTSEYITRPIVLRSELNFAIQKQFRKNSIEIPFPQRDIHIRSGTLNLKPQ